MLDLGVESKTPAAPPHHSAARIYWRLIGFALRYKGRLMLSLLFALFIAVSFGAMLVSVGAMVNLTFYETPAGSAYPDPEDPATELVDKIQHYSDTLRGTLGWAPQGMDTWLLTKVALMRAEKMRALVYMCAFLVSLTLLVGIARYLQEYFAGSIGASITTDLGQAMYENVVHQPVGFFESKPSGEILSRFTNDIFMVNRGLSGVFVKLMREPLKAVAFLFVAVSVDWKLTLIGVGVLPLVLYILIFIGKKMRKSVRRSLQRVASMASIVGETTRGITIVKGYTMEDYEIRRVQGEVKKLRRFLLQMVKLHAATGPTTELILVIGVSAFVLVSGHRVVAGHLAVGDLLRLYLALAMMLDPMRKMSDVNNMIQTSIASAERVFEFIDLKPDVVEDPDPVTLAPLRESLVFEDLHFGYTPNQEVLRGITLEIKKGEMVALVGFSGAGKSTLAKLIPRFYDLNAGRILLDGTDIRKASFKSLRDQIGIVTQDTILFAESVRDNITYGKANYSEERIRAAASAAHALEFIEALPHGFDEVIGEEGGTLSGGQRQRLAIARAIIKDPAILILDEATSSLDTESERLIQDALDQFVEGRTAIVIAHRLSTIQRADRIVVLEAGRIVETGTHQELLDQGGIYRRLYETQFGVEDKE